MSYYLLKCLKLYLTQHGLCNHVINKMEWLLNIHFCIIHEYLIMIFLSVPSMDNITFYYFIQSIQTYLQEVQPNKELPGPPIERSTPVIYCCSFLLLSTCSPCPLEVCSYLFVWVSFESFSFMSGEPWLHFHFLKYCTQRQIRRPHWGAIVWQTALTGHLAEISGYFDGGPSGVHASRSFFGVG